MTIPRLRSIRSRSLAVAVAASACVAAPISAQTTYSAAASTAALIQPTVDAFRLALGPLNPNLVGSQGTGRREINWDGVPDLFSDPNILPANFFNVNSPRGVQFATPGTGFMTSANSGGGPAVRFGSIDPTYSTSFTAFSEQRLFTPIGSNILDVNFFVPGSLTPATTRGFGAVFSDVDLANTTSLAFFDASNVSLGTFFASAASGSGGFSFLGVTFASALVSRVRITLGNTALAAGATDQNGSTRDVVVLDDFIYGEPMSVSTVPEPASIALLAGGLAVLAFAARRRRG